MRLHARRVARGAPGAPAVVLVHGLGMSSRSMTPAMLALAERHPAWAPDLPGFGASTKPRRALTLPELADALVGWMDAVGLERPALIGHSLGCQVIGHVAMRHPHRMRAAVLISPTIDPDAGRGPLGQLVAVMLDAPREDPRLVPIAFLDYLRAGPLRIWRTLRMALRDPARRHLAQVAAPTLVVRGGRDPLVSQAWAEEVARLLPLGRLAVVPGGAHAMNFSTPRALAGEILPFLDGLATETASSRPLEQGER